MAQHQKKAEASQKPVQVFRALGVKVSVFANKMTSEGKEVVYHKTTLQRVYRAGDEFKTTNSLNRNDIPVARRLLEKAWDWILDAEAKQNKEE